MKDIDINEYIYDLPSDRIAQYPANERDKSQFLIYRKGRIARDVFSNIDNYLPADSLLVFNNTRVIRARLIFRKETGALIEILCLEPVSPSDYLLSFSSKDPVYWKCIIGNLKKWKHGILTLPFSNNGVLLYLSAEKIKPEGEAWIIRFSWKPVEMSFGEVIEATGHIPLPPYIDREDELLDAERYQTVYSSIKGSVAAPTAGLHFTDNTLTRIRKKGIKTAELTLHVGAGTFKPIKADKIKNHVMHTEHFVVDAGLIRMLYENTGKVIAVGTTSVRTLESLFWLGVKLAGSNSESNHHLSVDQWAPYEIKTTLTLKESLKAILNYMKVKKESCLKASTSIIIIPGYRFRIINGIITNFHQPGSTLLLLISAWTGIKWKEIYKFALSNEFRFLSYGDSSLLLK